MHGVIYILIGGFYFHLANYQKNSVGFSRKTNQNRGSTLDGYTISMGKMIGDRLFSISKNSPRISQNIVKIEELYKRID